MEDAAYSPSIQTLIATGVFTFGYLSFLFVKTASKKIDLYDFVMLSNLALTPCVFLFFPDFSHFIAKLFGVRFPFVILFGLLFFVVFILLNRILRSIHRLEAQNRRLTQELSVAEAKLNQVPGPKW